MPNHRLLFLLLLLTAFCRSSPAATREVSWNPLEQQVAEPDTLYLLDADAEKFLQPGEGGLIPGNPGENKPWSKVVPVPGKFRAGLQSNDRNYGYVWMPMIGLIAPDEWTVEAWIKSDKPWEQVEDHSPLVLWDEHEAVRLELHMAGGTLDLSFRHQQDEAPVQASIRYDLKKNPLPANEWENMACTYKAGTLRLYLNAKLIGEASGIKPMRLWSDAGRGDGLSILGGYGRGANGFSLSDLRISRKARVPGEKITVSDANTLTVAATTNGTVQPNLLGALHYLAGPRTEEMAKGALKVMRTDKLLTATPMKAGVPDAAHPTAGASGKYSYDWQVVDRTFDYYKRLGVMPYISIDSTPSILGGKTPPFSGDNLTKGFSGWSGFTPEVPNDMAAFGSIVGDLVSHVVKERKDKVPYWGVWNEPDGPSFWSNKLEDYLAVYQTCAAAVKSVDPKLKVGGPEIAEFDPKWIEGLIKYCAQNKVPLDFVSWHYYLSTVVEIQQVRLAVDRWTKQYALPGKMDLICGEWCWQASNFPKTGYVPWRTRNYYINDWHAAFTAASLMEMQRAGVLLSIYTNPVAEEDGGGFDASGLMSKTEPWANLNVFRMWSKLLPRVVDTSYEGAPGIFSQASRDDSGRYTILLAHLRYRKDFSPDVTIKLPANLRNAQMTHYVVDDAHSDRYDCRHAGDGHARMLETIEQQEQRLKACDAHADLETMAAPKIEHNQLTVTLRPRSVHLLVIEPVK